MQIPRPNILVLMATKNGQEFIAQQLDSILQQALVNVFILISDDSSTDLTTKIIKQYTDKHSNIHLLPTHSTPFGNAENNFFYLISLSNCILNANKTKPNIPNLFFEHKFDAIAFADQDDIWQHWKLHKHYTIMQTRANTHGVSSSVTAFCNKKIIEINKHNAQTQADHLFESAGPGCTFLISPYLLNQVAHMLSIHTPSIAHDWFVYALCREHNLSWHIDAGKSVLYRQHTNNQMGINKGIRQNLKRLQSIKNKQYAQSTLELIEIFSTELNAHNHNKTLNKIKYAVRQSHNTSISRLARTRARIALASNAWHLRRKPIDKIILFILILANIW